MTKEIAINKNIKIGGGNFIIIAGPCVIENEGIVFETAKKLKQISEKLGFNYVFKCSYDKANRSSIASYRGPGLEKGLKILSDVKEHFSLPILTDVHSIDEITQVAENVDIIQIPAFLCRQTDLILTAAKTGKIVNIKKGQFLSPKDIKNVIEKFTSTGNHNLTITERGTSFGYNNLVVDFTSIPIMQEFGYPVIFDATHSVQKPGGLENKSGGDRQYAHYLAKAAVAIGADGLFFEVHPNPNEALCDGKNMLFLNQVEKFLESIKELMSNVRNSSRS